MNIVITMLLHEPESSYDIYEGKIHIRNSVSECISKCKSVRQPSVLREVFEDNHKGITNIVEFYKPPSILEKCKNPNNKKNNNNSNNY